MRKFLITFIILSTIELYSNPYKCIIKEDTKPFYFPDKNSTIANYALTSGKTFNGYFTGNWIYGAPWFFTKEQIICSEYTHSKYWTFNIPIKLFNNTNSKSLKITISNDNNYSYINASSATGLLIWSIPYSTKNLNSDINDLTNWNLLAIDDINNDNTDDFFVIIGSGNVFTKLYLILSINQKYQTNLLLETYESIINTPFGIKELNGGILRELWYSKMKKEIFLEVEYLSNVFSKRNSIALTWEEKTNTWKSKNNKQ
ncbi:hypothetical protein [Leptospira bandrabouensis]|uniref:hypothetical protein n=1 Tax=Leptospira bandrabouensis TaxID=2484903 RepID=UPI001EE8B0DE|nr:hypothetical protein [Leptospira bandrabouensis]MCG6146553.1 hypothetical protein [Leptospira bandrabouensis]MCG6161926.1 hypothetical protein [Leptospira bandrabouensis]MCG6166109.1 hypothetical protein [Leptospira bandrabouensis]